MNPSFLNVERLQKLPQTGQIASPSDDALTDYQNSLPPQKSVFSSFSQRTTKPPRYSTEDFQRAIETISSQIGYHLGLDSEALFQQKIQLLITNKKPLTVGSLKKFLAQEKAKGKPMVVSYGETSLPEFGKWYAEEILRSNFSKKLQQQCNTIQSASEELTSFEQDAQRSNTYTTHLSEKTLSSKDAPTKKQKVALTDDAINAITQATIDTLPKSHDREAMLNRLKTELLSLSHQGVLAQLLLSSPLPEGKPIITGACAMDVAYSLLEPQKIQITITAQFSPRQGNTFYYQSPSGVESLFSEEKKAAGNIIFTLQASVNKQGNIDTMTCPSLEGSWKVTAL